MARQTLQQGDAETIVLPLPDGLTPTGATCTLEVLTSKFAADGSGTTYAGTFTGSAGTGWYASFAIPQSATLTQLVAWFHARHTVTSSGAQSTIDADVWRVVPYSSTTSPAAVTPLALHIADPTAAHAASAISNVPAGAVTATDAQAAINQVEAHVVAEASTARAAEIANAAAIAALTAGADSSLDTFLEAYSRFLTDESAAAALTTAVGGKLAKASNLSDLPSASTARTNLGLGTASTKDTGTGLTQVVLGDDARLGNGALATQVFMELLHLGLPANWLELGDSTGNETTEHVYLEVVALAAAWTSHTWQYRLWDDTAHAYAAAVTVANRGASAPVVTVWNCSVAGRATPYYLAPYLQQMVIATQADLITISQGHNEALVGNPGGSEFNIAGADFRQRYLALRETISLVMPQASILHQAQNPEAHRTITDGVLANGSTTFTSATAAFTANDVGKHVYGTGLNASATVGAYVSPTQVTLSLAATADVNPATVQIGRSDQANKAVEIERIAMMRGDGFANPHRAFVDTGDGPSYPTYLNADGIHPNAAGSALWAAEVLKAFVYVPNAGPRSQQPSSLAEPCEPLWNNLDFSTFSAWDGVNPTTTPPDGWSATNCTFSRDTVNFKTKGYSLRVQPTAAGASSSIWQDMPAANLERVRGRWVNVAALADVKAGNPSTAGRLSIEVRAPSTYVSDPSTTRTLASPSEDQGMGDFRVIPEWAFIPTDTDRIRLRQYCDSGTTGVADVLLDSLYPSQGWLLKGTYGTPGATGAAGALIAMGVQTANQALSGLPTVDGHTFVAGELILLVGQTTASQNGVWTVAAGAWTRPTSFAVGFSFLAQLVQVAGGTLFAGSLWECATGTAKVVGTDTLAWIRVGAQNITKTVAAAGAAQTIDFRPYDVVDLTASAASCALTFSNTPGRGAMRLLLHQDGTGGRAWTFVSTIRWPGGVAFSPSTAASAVDEVAILANADGTFSGFFQKAMA